MIPLTIPGDRDEAAFRDKLWVIARQKPKDESAKPNKSASAASFSEVMASARRLRSDLAEAEKELAAAEERFDRYTGNNPNKYQSDLRRLRRKVKDLGELVG